MCVHVCIVCMCQVKVVLQVFDVLLLNGRSLLRLPLAHRRALLHQSFRYEGNEMREGVPFMENIYPGTYLVLLLSPILIESSCVTLQE